jgi:leucyl aminopeptidase (aminopeptidase T)
VELAIGNESRDDYLTFELTAAALKLVTEVRPVGRGQQVLISVDSAGDMRAARATAGAVQAVGGVPTVVSYPTLPEPMSQPPRPLAQAVLGADVWIDFAVAYQLYSPAYHAAVANGCIYVCLTGMDVDMMVRTIGRVSYAPMEEMARVLYRMSQAAEVIRLTSPVGTDLRMTVDKKGDPFWEDEKHGGYAQMLGGQSGPMAYRESFEGSLVYDGAIWPPAEIGILRSPVRLTIEQGYATRIEGGAEAALYDRWLRSFESPAAMLMDHACYGFNPGVRRPSGRILEDERIFGCMQFGIGATELGSPIHSDGVVLNPSVWFDDVQVEEAGRYVHPDLARLCREMGVAEYS